MSGTLARTIALSTAALITLAACSSTGDGGDASGTAPAAGGQRVRLITYESYAISEATLDTFTEQTGLEVEVIRAGDAGAMVNRALLTKENPEADLLFGIDNNLISRALDEDLFAPYRPDAADEIPDDLKLDGDDAATPIDTGDVCINYDREFYENSDSGAPTGLADLTKPEYQDQLVVENPATSTPGLAFLLATVAEFGEDGYLDYWGELRDRGVRIENSWDTAYQAQFSGGSGAGERPLVVSYASSPAAEVIFAEKKLTESPTGAVLSTCYRQIEYAGVLRSAENEAGARELLDFMLTETYQADIPLNNFVYPVLPGVELPAEFAEFAPTPEDPLSLPPERVAEQRDTWVRDWTDTMQR